MHVLGVSTSGYYAYLKRPNNKYLLKDNKFLTKIKRAYTLHKGTYGAKRIAKVLKFKGTLVNHKKVARIMREANLKAISKTSKNYNKYKI